MKIFKTFLMLHLVLFTFGGVYGAEVNINEAETYINQEISIKARTGYIKEQNANQIIFTARDDYNNQILVYTANQKDLVMGVTYIIRGIPQKDSVGNIYLQEASRKRAFFTFRPWMIISLVALLVFMCAAILYIRSKSIVPPTWGVLSVINGAYRNQSFNLSYRETILGRKQTAKNTINLTLEKSISRRHGRIIREHDGRIFYEDLGSSNGSFLNEDRITPNTRIPLTFVQSISTLRLGADCIIQIARNNSPDQDSSGDGTVVGGSNAGGSDTTV